MPVRVIVTDGTTAGCSQHTILVKGLKCEFLIADKGYDSNEIIHFAQQDHFIPVILPRKSRLVHRNCDKYLYKMRHIIENTFLKMKTGRGIAHRFSSYLLCFVLNYFDDTP